jgi:hypothetical protein
MTSYLQLQQKKLPLSKKALVRPDQNILRWSALFATSSFKGKSRVISYKTNEDRELSVIIGLQLDDRGKEISVGVVRVPDFISFTTLIQIWELTGKPADSYVQCRLPDFLQLSGKRRDGQKNYRNAIASLNRLHTIPITWYGCYKLKDHQSISQLEVLERMTILSGLKWVKAKSKSGKREHIAFKFRFHDMILQNLVSGYTRPFNHRVLTSFQHELAVLTYAHLDTVMADKTIYTPWSRTLFRQLGLDGPMYRYPSGRWQRFEPVVKELQQRPLSTGILSIQIEHLNRRGKDWKLVCRKLPFAALSARRSDQAALEHYVNVALALVREQNNDITRKFLFKAGHRLGPEAIYQTARVLKADYIDNPTATVKTSLGAILVDELQRLAEARGVSLD